MTENNVFREYNECKKSKKGEVNMNFKKIILFMLVLALISVGSNVFGATPIKWFKAGTYKVGKDIKVGEYFIQSTNNSLGAYFQVSKDSTGKLTSITTNDNFKGNRYITLVSGQYFKVTNGRFAVASSVPKLAAVKGKYLEGMYKVGRDLPAGEYKVTPSSKIGSYYEVSKDSKGSLTSIVANEIIKSDTYLSVSNGQYVKFIGCFATAVTKSSSQTNSNTSTSKPVVQDNWIKAGTHKVGIDIKAGEYFVKAESDYSYFQIAKDSKGLLESIVANDIFAGNRYVTLEDGQYFQLRDAKMIPVNLAPVLTPTNGKFGNGMYKVGRDIKVGEYKVTPDESNSGYLEVAKDSRFLFDSIVTNSIVDADQYITITDGQYLKISRAYLLISN
jgi:hypothetical protein